MEMASDTKKNLKVYNPKKRTGLILVITGDGKGKTTAALGIALRATGYNMKTCMIQFIKGDMYSGEIDGVRRLAPNVELYLAGKGFCGIMGNTRPLEEHRASAQDAIKLAFQKMEDKDLDILILDEINNAITLGLVDLSQVIELIDRKPPLMHIILTGRNAHSDIIQKAHTVTEMKEIKHAIKQGIGPQKGIDI